MATAGVDVTLNKTCDLGLSTNTVTYDIGSGTMFYFGQGDISFRAYVDGSMSATGKVFNVKNINVQAKASGTSSSGSPLNVGITMTGFTTLFSGFSSTNTGKSYPQGMTVSSNNILSWTTIAIISTGNSTINSADESKTASLDITTNITCDKTVTKKLTIKLKFNAPKITRTLQYLKDDGSASGSPLKQAYGTTTTIKAGYTKSGYTDRDEGYYTVSFDSRGGTSVDSKQIKWSWSRPVTYTFSSWGGYPPGTTYTFISDKELKASFIENVGGRTWVWNKLGSLQTVYKKGYKKTNVWYYSNGEQANSSDQITSSQTLHVEWESQIYKILYNLNGGYMPENTGKITDYTTEKTYGVNTIKSPPFTPLRLGYLFAGWSNQDGTIQPIGADSYLNDAVYDSINTEYTNNNVTLYAKWNLNPNTVKCIYYAPNDSTYREDIAQYNIETSTVDTDGDKAYTKYSPNNQRGEDFVFIGWCDSKPDNWDNSEKVNDGYHGTYTLPPEYVLDEQGFKLEIEMPIDLKIKNYKNLEDWGIPETYYGIWAKTGKYIKVSGEWKKVNRTFVKINGQWKSITDIWTCVNDRSSDVNVRWKHEI